MPTDHTTGWVEPDITINGQALTFGEAMALRVAVNNFRLQLADSAFRAGIGERLAEGYEALLVRVEQAMRKGHPQ